jgi:hypothetical protein
MQLRHISPRSSDWVDAMDEGSGGRGWEKLAPEERTKLRAGELRGALEDGREDDQGDEEAGYGWGRSASR